MGYEKYIENLWNPDELSEGLNAIASLGEKLFKSGRSESVSPIQEIKDLKNRLEVAKEHIRKGEFEKGIELLGEGAVNLHHPHYMSQQLCAPASGSILGDTLSAMLNQGHAVFSMSPTHSLIEEEVLEWAKSRMNLPEGFVGVPTGGGSLSNLSALLSARNFLTSWGGWQNGDLPKVRIFTTEFAHYSIQRAAGIIGIGTESCEALATDQLGRMSLDALEKGLKNAAENGDHVVVVLTLGNTATGASDPVADAISLVHNNLPEAWIHVDAAHGGSFFHLQPLQDEFKALKSCDSLTWNPHKLFFQSIPLSLLFYRDYGRAEHLAEHDSPYLTQNYEGEFPDKSNLTLECSRRSNCLKLWMTLQLNDEGAILESHRHLVNLTNYASELFNELKGSDVIHAPQTNIVCFRWQRYNEDLGNREISEVINKINEQRDFSIGHTYIRNSLYLRVCFMNPKTTFHDVDNLIGTIAKFENYVTYTNNEGKSYSA